MVQRIEVLGSPGGGPAPGHPRAPRRADRDDALVEPDLPRRKRMVGAWAVVTLIDIEI